MKFQNSQNESMAIEIKTGCLCRGLGKRGYNQLERYEELKGAENILCICWQLHIYIIVKNQNCGLSMCILCKSHTIKKKNRSSQLDHRLPAFLCLSKSGVCLPHNELSPSYPFKYGTKPMYTFRHGLLGCHVFRTLALCIRFCMVAWASPPEITWPDLIVVSGIPVVRASINMHLWPHVSDPYCQILQKMLLSAAGDQLK